MPQLQQDSDKSRFAMVEAVKGVHDENLAENWALLNKYWQSIDEEWSRRFVARVIQNSELILHNIKTTRNYLNKIKNRDARFSDQFGTLMAASLFFKHKMEITKEEVEKIDQMLFSSTALIEEISAPDQELVCLKHILAAKIKDSSGLETRVQRELMRESISDDILTIMGEFGVIPCQEGQERGVFIRDTGDIRFHMRSLPNFEISFLKALARIEGAKKTHYTFQNNRYAGVFIPMSQIFTNPEKGNKKPDNQF